MQRFRPYYLPTAVMVLVSLLIGSITIYAAPFTTTTGTVQVCTGTTSSSAQVSMGGRVITPSTIIRSGPCASSEAGYNLFSYANTVLVSPQAGATAAQNGQSLLNVLGSITGASATNPYLLKIEPGIYDLGGSSLTMQPYIDVEGSGENVTQITSTANVSQNVGTVIGANNAEIRDLTVVNQGGTGYAQAIVANGTITTTFKISNVTANAYNGSVAAYGIYNNGGSPTIENSSIVVNSTLPNSSCFGIYNSTNAPLINNNRITLACNSNNTGVILGIFSTSSTVSMQNNILNISNSGVGDVNGIRVDNSSGTIQGSSITVTGNPSGNAFGIGTNSANGSTLLVASSFVTVTAGISYAAYNNYASGLVNKSTLNLQSSVLTAVTNSGSGKTYGLDANSTTYVQNSTVTAFPAPAGSYGVFLGSTNLYVDSSNLKGATNSVTGTGSLFAGASKLDGVLNITGSGTVKCVSSYNGSYTLLSASCS